jgi:glycosyltransferase involved in cell wall biosynthesis
MRVLMVSTEYPPMNGGVGRYAFNLTKALRKSGVDVFVLCEDKGNGDFFGLSPSNKDNSEVVLKVAGEIKPDVIHIQFEPGLYGLQPLNAFNPKSSKTYIDSLYSKCKLPIITTFHSAYSFREWMSQALTIKKTGRIGKWGIPLRIIVKVFMNLLYYRAFIELNKEKLRQSYAGICFSKYVSRLLDGGHVIYHGAEPALHPLPDKEEARRAFLLPLEKRIAVTVGFRTVTKGWDILDKVNLPKDWIIVSNSAQGYYNKETIEDKIHKNKKIIDLQRGFLSEEELSRLLLASDIVLLPYRITSGSGVMFDALAHGLPFVASDLEFFKEFEKMGLGITSKREPQAFASAIDKLGREYERFSNNVISFKEKLTWKYVAERHIEIYKKAENGN